ncbi:hypothetical protein RIF29_29760 [Crotalaria pallida]|uniref:Uncharacterized protein n=1 Tax=Crotalaria pallida TaxID=3830 RepID=A0AAN9EFJ4_CROPI
MTLSSSFNRVLRHFYCNILNFNVGASVDLDIPRSFWSRLAGKYGNIFYWKEKGEDASIEAAVMAISNCLREPVGPNNCSELEYLRVISPLDDKETAVHFREREHPSSYMVEMRRLESVSLFK